MKSIKRILFSVLSERSYLRLLHRSFYFLFDLGILKRDSKFKYHYKVRSLINENDVVMDIGANLGYFAKTFSRAAKNGKIICVEPLPQYYDVLNHFLGKKSNVHIHNVALGKSPGIATMVLPMQDGMIRTGLPHISTRPQNNNVRTQDVKIVNPLSLIKDETRLDYIKCDVEGYEWIIFQELKPAIKTHLPLIQVEIAEENIENFIAFFKTLEYVQYGISDFKFEKDNGHQKEAGDFLFIPKTKEAQFLKNLK